MKEGKKPIYKKWWAWLIAFFAVLVIYAAATGVNQAQEELDNEEPAEAAAAEVDETQDEAEEQEELTREEEIQAFVQSIVDEDLNRTVINSNDVNYNAGQDDGTYLALPKLTWEVKNSADTTRDMLKQYSDHLAAKLAEESDISDVTVFWEVPHHKEGDNVAKFEYSRQDDGMAIGDVWYDELIRE